MKKGIHPEYRQVLFHDVSVDEYFLIPSTLSTDQTKEWKDGKTYPYCPLDVKYHLDVSFLSCSGTKEMSFKDSSILE